MLTIDKLTAYGADVPTGLARCMNNEAFYLRMVGMMQSDTNVTALQEALQAGDWEAAFNAAHTLKGVLANLSLTPLEKPIMELTELLRPRQPVDPAAYSALLTEAQQQWQALQSLLAS